jgi:hypothetical protein
MITFGQNNFHPSQNFFFAAGRHIKATDMVQPVVEQLIRLQREIQAFDVTTGRKIVICGGLVMGTGDNPTASDLCAHSWKSNRPCRVCLFAHRCSPISSDEITCWDQKRKLGAKRRTWDETNPHSFLRTPRGQPTLGLDV